MSIVEVPCPFYPRKAYYTTYLPYLKELHLQDRTLIDFPASMVLNKIHLSAKSYGQIVGKGVSLKRKGVFCGKGRFAQIPETPLVKRMIATL